MPTQEVSGYEHLTSGGPERRIHEELAKLVYGRGEQLRALAFDRIGLSTDDLQPGVRYTARVSSNDRRLVATINDDSQLRVGEKTLRSITVQEKDNGVDTFRWGRYVQHDGKMWQIADSSQGEPWHEADLSNDVLVGMVERMEQLGAGDCEVEVVTSAFYRP